MANRINLLVIGGVRPQFIKMAAFKWAINKYNSKSSDLFDAKYVNTGQHYDESLSTQIINELGLAFDFQFGFDDKDPINIMGHMFIELSKLFDTINPKPDWVVVMGDATTAFVGAVVAARRGYPVIHLEAGVRSGRLASVEEMHRRMISHIATVHFCTSRTGVHNLAVENVTRNVYWTGDLAHDYIIDSANAGNQLPGRLKDGYILLTLHKSSNLDSATVIRNLISTLTEYQRRTLFLVHPRTKKKLMEFGVDATASIGNIMFVAPLPYKDMLTALSNCSFVITDSGGLQREAYYLKKRCLVRREHVGWTNFLDAGVHRLIGGGVSDIKSGLDWAEQSLETNYPNIDDEFIRSDSWEFALDTLVNLSYHSTNSSV